MKNINQYIKTIFFILIINVLLLLFLEGLTSTFVVVRDFIRSVDRPPERRYTKYDDLLGWSNIPNHEVKDLYGTGIYLKTNSQGFRNHQDFSLEVPRGKTRIICCGDSFALGHGVDNEHAWCEQLSSIDKRLETINMGQAGYGIDQAYLWYMRDGRKLEHNIHLFAFTTEDFDRMKDKERAFYGKPVLKVVKGELKIDNVPVPKYPLVLRKLREHTQESQFRLYELLRRIIKKICLSSIPNKNSQKKDTGLIAFDDENKETVLKVFESLQKVNKEKDSTLILVYLPSDEDYIYYQPETNLWREWLKIETAKRKILYIDLYDDFLKMSFAEAVTLFNARDRHYSNKGNKFVAEVLYRKLLSLGKIK